IDPHDTRREKRSIGIGRRFAADPAVVVERQHATRCCRTGRLFVRRPGARLHRGARRHRTNRHPLEPAEIGAYEAKTHFGCFARAGRGKGTGSRSPNSAVRSRDPNRSSAQAPIGGAKRYAPVFPLRRYSATFSAVPNIGEFLASTNTSSPSVVNGSV